MLTLHSKLEHEKKEDAVIVAELILPYDLREKSRLRAKMSNGEEVGVFTVRGTVMRDGDLMVGDDGRVVKIVAAEEACYRVQCENAFQLLRCAFHLGNRHTQAQLGDGYLRIRRDPVLKEMLQGLGATVQEELASFEPESGAYGGGHHHGADDGHHHGFPSLLAPIPLRQKIHRPSDKAEDSPTEKLGS
ncbi:urease accessory protein UreE [Undibacterium sp. LX40W]|uniref:Urease accessory protein UreE n=1 Tax=Undibacterium nitidum TaxID=2762298 RepID=A0A923HNB2_9BURK|nr:MULTISPECIES: urease accessory protein UreE [Undibacterium]MBC3882207.1 urease accessory protein UreE [Undibacterium nitidum]MBC3892488.1 urease accessory protein UreE [Undibacterium sp. LX40W]